jgi:hypothetical protein
MATNIIVLKKPGGDQLISPGVVSTLDASGFDVVTARYISQTTAIAITQAKLPGSTQALPIGITVNGNAKMVFMGVSETADLPGNCCEYTMTWRGLLVTLTGRDEQVTETRSVRERNFDAITGIKPGPTGVKARIMELQAGISVRSIATIKPPAPSISASAGTGQLHGVNAPTNQYKVTNAPVTYIYPHGWVCYAWQSEQVLPGIWFVTAEYKYEFETQSG